jgi:hypothetical protein
MSLKDLAVKTYRQSEELKAQEKTRIRMTKEETRVNNILNLTKEVEPIIISEFCKKFTKF